MMNRFIKCKVNCKKTAYRSKVLILFTSVDGMKCTRPNIILYLSLSTQITCKIQRRLVCARARACVKHQPQDVPVECNRRGVLINQQEVADISNVLYSAPKQQQLLIFTPVNHTQFASLNSKDVFSFFFCAPAKYNFACEHINSVVYFFNAGKELLSVKTWKQ